MPGPAMPPGPGMPPEGGPPMPPAGGPPGAPPPPGGGAGPEDLAAAQQQAMDQQRQMIAESAPAPEEAIPIETINQIIDELNGVLEAIGKALPPEYDPPSPVVWEPPQGEKTWSAPLPPEVWVPFMVILALAGRLVESDFDPTTMTTPAEYKAAVAKLRTLANNKKFIEAATADISGGPAAEESAMPPGGPAPAPTPEQAGGESPMMRAV